MSHSSNIIMDWDRLGDVMYVLRSGFIPDDLVNIDSDKVPGMVKRLDPQTRECVGFIIHSFSHRFKAYTGMSEDNLKVLWDMSLNLTNERNAIAAA